MGKITIAHGSGGKISHDLIKNLFFKKLNNEILNKADDAAIIENCSEKIAFTTDSFVIKPIFFPGGDIGKLSVCGTVNDLAVSGAVPKYLSCGFIIEEGFNEENLIRITESISIWAEKAGVKLVTGDTKVVEKGAADGIYINTSGLGYVKEDITLGKDRIKKGDKVILTGTIGDHGIAVLGTRKGLQFESEIKSDCAPLNKMLTEVLDSGADVKFMRDPTRGGLATTLNEISMDQGFGITVYEEKIPIKEEVRAVSELLGLDPLYIANEGKAIIICDPSSEDKILNVLRNNEYGKDSKVIGEITEDYSGKVLMRTLYGVNRILEMLSGEPMPRIC